MSSKEFWEELKRRHVYRVAVAYVIVGWLLIQVVTQVFPVFHLPDWIDQAVVLLILIGFPIALVLAWAFDATAQGIVLTDAMPDATGTGAMPPRRSRRAGMAVGLIGVLIALIAGGAYWHFGQHRSAASRKAVATTLPAASGASSKSAQGASVTPPTPTAQTPVAAQPIPAKSIAVLPFENLSTDKSNAYFADGMQDLILTKLADIGQLKVIARTSTESYGSHPENLTLVGQQLGVATLLEGSVQKAGNQVLINVQLIDAKTDAHLWAQSYTRTLDNVFGVEGEVAGQIATALNAKLSPREVAAVANVPTNNPAAYDAYLRGESYLDQMWAGGFAVLPKAVASFQQAVDHDPQFALAWAQLAFSQSMLNYARIDTSDATRQKALANAQHALALAPDLPRAHYALGYVYRFGFADYDKALAQFKIAQRGSPNDAKVEAAIAYIEGIRGNDSVALADLQRATALNPRDPNLALAVGWEQEALNQYDQARVAFQRMLAIAPDDPEAYANLAHLDVLQHGDVPAALAQLDKAPANLRSSPEILSWRVRLLLLQRNYKAARQAADTLRSGGRFISPLRVLMWRALVSRLSGDAQGAKALYQQALVMAKAANASEATRYYQLPIAAAQAGLGHRAEALQALNNFAAQLNRMGIHSGIEVDALSLARANVEVMLGDTNMAIAALAKALASPGIGYNYSPVMLWIDPGWDPIRHDPRFEALQKKYASAKPAAKSIAAAP